MLVQKFLTTLKGKLTKRQRSPNVYAELFTSEGVYANAGQAWRDWVDMMYEHGLRGSVTDRRFKDLWLKSNRLADFDPDTGDWRTIVQFAFISGYESGFTDNIFKGNQNGK